MFPICGVLSPIGLLVAPEWWVLNLVRCICFPFCEVGIILVLIIEL
jgi:hypothetical protein